MKLRDNTDCPYLHDIFDQYCNLFKGYKNCDKCDCEVLKILKENWQLREQIEKMKNCINCKYFVDSDNVCNQGLYLANREFTECYEWELAE